MARAKIPQSTQTNLLVASRRRCALCFGLEHDLGVKAGQIAHVDRNPQNHDPENLAWLCLDHHDKYDSRTSQSKGLTEQELKHYRADLYSFNESARARLEPYRPHTSLSPEAAPLARFLNERSKNGTKFDPQELIHELPGLLGVSEEDVEIAIDELQDNGLIEQNGSHDIVYVVDRLFWETDPLFSDSDPVLDAQAVAKFLVAQTSDRINLSIIAESLGWSARQLNPAATYLVSSGLAKSREGLGSAPYSMFAITRTTKTKRFVRELNE